MVGVIKRTVEGECAGIIQAEALEKMPELPVNGQCRRGQHPGTAMPGPLTRHLLRDVQGGQAQVKSLAACLHPAHLPPLIRLGEKALEILIQRIGPSMTTLQALPPRCLRCQGCDPFSQRMRQRLGGLTHRPFERAPCRAHPIAEHQTQVGRRPLQARRLLGQARRITRLTLLLKPDIAGQVKKLTTRDT
jgi:hypothetical protein